MVENTLHIVDGECTGGTIKKSGFARSKQILCWRDALYTGPVPAKLTLRQLSRLRSHFWTNRKKSTEFDKRDAALQKHTQYEHIVLWFGPNCVLCQLSLIQILSWFREQGISAARLSWAAQHGGELHPNQIPAAWEKRKPITSAQMRLAERAWRAFRQRTPAGMSRLLRTDLRAVLGLRLALTRLLQEYPSSENGLSRLEMLLLRAIQKAGSLRAAEAVGSIITKETVGDTLLFDMLHALVEAPHPLVERAETEDPKIRNYHYGSILKLTNAGRRVLAGKTDAIGLNGIDRWIGGVHLRGRNIPWRWERSTKRIVVA